MQTNATTSLSITLADPRYLLWLTGLDGNASPPLLARAQINEVFRKALLSAGIPSQFLRVYWYYDTDDHAVVDDQTLRLLPNPDSDGAALVRQMAQDLGALIAGGRVDVVLIASDDDRLLPAIDAAKLAGIRVCMLADERAQSMPELFESDPNWARFLREADRRLIVPSSELAQALLQSGGSAQAKDRAGDAPRLDLTSLINTWWQEMSAEDRQALREELPELRGLPPETDRDLLLRAKRVIGRALNFQEKRSLRAHARRMGLSGEIAEAGGAVEAPREL